MGADDAPSRPEGRVPARVRWAILALASLLLVVIGLDQAAHDAPGIDESVDVTSGLAIVVHHDLRMVPEHPALPKAVAALPALIAQPIVPKTEAWDEGDWFDWSDDVIAANEEAGRLRPMLFWARTVVLVEVLAIGALLYVLASRSFGPDGGLLVALVWLTIPYVVGLGHFAGIDVAFTLAVLGVLLLLARWRDHPTTGRLVALGAGLGAALATRHTAIVLVALVVAVVAIERRHQPRDAAKDVAIVGLVAVAGLWLIYRALDPTGPAPETAARFEGIVSAAGGSSAVARLVGALPLPLEWRGGFAYLIETSGDRPSSLLGQSWDGGRWWYFPMSAVLTIPLTTVIAVVAGWVLAARRGWGRRELVTVVAVPALVLWLFLVAQPLNLGLRLALPTVALALVGLGALAEVALAQRSRGARVALAAVAVVVAAQLLATAVAPRHSLAWSPPPFTPAYRWVSDANVDVGQAVYELRDWAEGEDAPYVAYDRARGIEVEGGSRDLLDADVAEITGPVAVGITSLMQTRRDELAWLRAYCPVDTLAGGAVLVYRFDEPPDPAPGPERPVSPCWGASSSTRTG